MDQVVPDCTSPRAYTCSVYKCTSSSGQTNPPEFYTFPRELERCSVWVRRCNKREVSEAFKRHGMKRLRARFKVCSEHFQEGDFINPEVKSMGLKSDAVPSRNFQPRLSESCSLSDCSTPTPCSSGSESDKPLSLHVPLQPKTISSDTSDDLLSVREDGTPNERGIMLQRRLLEKERKNSRLKRALQRARKRGIVCRPTFT